MGKQQVHMHGDQLHLLLASACAYRTKDARSGSLQEERQQLCGL
jgi:hypothetical protein